MESGRSYNIVLLPGDGIGPEVTEEMRATVGQAATRFGFSVNWSIHLIGGAATDETGSPLPDATRDACLQADASFLGAVGGPRWDGIEPDKRPEKGLLGLRKALSVFANVRPVRVNAALAQLSPLRPERVANVDLVVVRELTGGIYFGKPSVRTDTNAVSTMMYSVSEIERITKIAFEQARARRNKVTSVDKANVLAVSQLWRDTVNNIHDSMYPDVELNHMYVDNAAMQLVLDPGQFDVILTGNLFGDILSDVSAVLPGSLGLLPSASLGLHNGLFEPVHGSAPELAGLDVANPVAAILSGSMMLHFLGESEAAKAVSSAVEKTLEEGARTADLIRGADHPASLSTSEVGRLIRANLKQPALF